MTWIERINIAEHDGAFSSEDNMLAESWVTCACGEQDPRIPRNSIGNPLDDELDTLGMDFMRHVQYASFDEARATLKKIEKRARQVLRGLPK